MVQIEENAFRVWRQVQKTTQKNHVKVRMKTIDATGMIMFAQGADKQDFLTVELVSGKIRLAIF